MLSRHQISHITKLCETLSIKSWMNVSRIQIRSHWWISIPKVSCAYVNLHSPSWTCLSSKLSCYTCLEAFNRKFDLLSSSSQKKISGHMRLSSQRFFNTVIKTTLLLLLSTRLRSSNDGRLIYAEISTWITTHSRRILVYFDNVGPPWSFWQVVMKQPSVRTICQLSWWPSLSSTACPTSFGTSLFHNKWRLIRDEVANISDHIAYVAPSTFPLKIKPGESVKFRDDWTMELPNVSSKAPDNGFLFMNKPTASALLFKWIQNRLVPVYVTSTPRATYARSRGASDAILRQLRIPHGFWLFSSRYDHAWVLVSESSTCHTLLHQRGLMGDNQRW